MTIDARLHRPSGALSTLSNGRHVWNADVGKALGSEDRAPGPHDLLDSALAACTVLTLDQYLRRSGWPVTDLHVVIERAEERGPEGRVHYRMERRIAIEGDITEEQRARLLAITEKCPIHRVLAGEISVVTALA
jgi:putative redox protein